MPGTMRILHFVGFVIWIGGAIGTLVADGVLQRMDRSLWGGVAEVHAAIYRTLIGPGSMLTVITGFILTMQSYGQMSLTVGHWLGVMQGVGILAALVTLLGAMPAAFRLGRLEPVGAAAGAFDKARRRLFVFGWTGSLLSLVALLAGALYRVPGL